MKVKYFDENTEQLLTIEEVKALYDNTADKTEYTFSEWFKAVQSYNNGSLTEYHNYSMTVLNDETDRAFDIVSAGSSPKNACDNYCIAHDMDYILIPVSYRPIDF